MANHVLNFFCFSLFFTFSLIHVSADNGEDRKVYIVYMGALPEKEYSPSSHHYSMLQEVVHTSSVESVLVRSYKKSFNGFAAKLTDLEAQKFLGMKEVVSVFPSRTFQLHTTRSWSFMGFEETAKRRPQAESDVIIGVLDTGIWPESASFSDEGFGPPPKKWKGICDGGTNFTCNNSPRDKLGHGSHTASTAAGNVVNDVSFYGFARGTAKGGVPSARIAVYKVCDEINGCDEDIILAGFDDAISDGVDIISVSLGSTSEIFLFDDAISIGAFHAVEKGVLTAQSAGNSGPSIQSLASLAPWVLTVAASTTDRRIIDSVLLGDGKTLTGGAVNSFAENRTAIPLIYGRDAPNICSPSAAASCEDGCINSSLAQGKIVLCDHFRGIPEAFRSGAFGAIVRSTCTDVSITYPLPALSLSPDDYAAVKSYYNTTKSPVARIFRSDVIKDNAAPQVAYFSARGPNVAAPDILKPDVTAPAVNILAAFPPITSPSNTPEDSRRVKYNLQSGTSMSCPHVAGIAAYVKTFHPDWSPSAIKSAIMTTAFPMNATENPDREYAYGSGHVNPVKAVNPGLVYESTTADYIKLICSLGYDSRAFTGGNTSCPPGFQKFLPKDFNYPSMTMNVAENKTFKAVFHRTVTNVGSANSSYRAKVSTDFELKIAVVPEVLSFEELNEKKSFDVTVSGGILKANEMVSGSLEWFDGTFSVRSPIVVHTQRPFA